MLEETVQELAWSHHLSLTHKFIHHPWPHPFSQRCMCLPVSYTEKVFLLQHQLTNKVKDPGLQNRVLNGAPRIAFCKWFLRSAPCA
jgi:hypothetical protein